MILTFGRETSEDADGHQGEYRNIRVRVLQVAALTLINMAAAAISLKCLTIPAIGKHTATVVFVHVSISLSMRVSPLHDTTLFSGFQGLGDTGHGWQPVADMFKVDPDLAHVKWVLPHSYV
jgi:hypothetical protein